MKQKFIEWFTKNNNGCSPAMEDDRSFVREKTQHMFEAYQAGVAEGEARCAALAAENAGMNAFVDALLSIAWQGGSADGAEIQDLALKHGLLRQDVYSADEHETLVDDPGNFEDGDPVYFRVETPATDVFLAEVRAQGVEMFAKEMHADISGDDAREFAAQIRKGGATEEKQSFLSDEDCHAFIKAYTKGAAQ
ncbi:TPA: hypothetical protein QIT10_003603 [Enterobacter bugandensis]|nr:hypothetical protein [Enterobacter bugandensis]HEP0376174.1 hypothetical protein [Enterobacter bugandensis]